jgi:hypothetical protein
MYYAFSAFPVLISRHYFSCIISPSYIINQLHGAELSLKYHTSAAGQKFLTLHTRARTHARKHTIHVNEKYVSFYFTVFF